MAESLSLVGRRSCRLAGLTRITVATIAMSTLLHLLSATALAQAPAPADAKEIDRRVAGILADWENLPGVFDDVEVYAGQIKELVRQFAAEGSRLVLHYHRGQARIRRRSGGIAGSQSRPDA